MGRGSQGTVAQGAVGFLLGRRIFQFLQFENISSGYYLYDLLDVWVGGATGRPELKIIYFSSTQVAIDSSFVKLEVTPPSSLKDSALADA